MTRGVGRSFLVPLLAASLCAQGPGVTLGGAPAATIDGAYGLRLTAPPGSPYVVDLGFSGASPGTPLGPGSPVVPLNRPWVYLDLFGHSPAVASNFGGFLGVIDASGAATPILVLPNVPALSGLSAHAAAVVATGGGLSVSAAVPLTFVGGATVPAGVLAPFRPGAPPHPATRFVSPGGSDANNGLTPATAWRQISHAAAVIPAGAVVEIADGSYAGPVLLRNLHATAAQPTVFRASGGNAVVVGSANTNNDDRNGFFIGDCRHVIVHGLRLQNSERAGVRVSLSHQVTLQALVCTGHRKWGIFTDYADDLRILGCECAGSLDEHGIYHSNSGDRAVIVGNWCHDNRASGIQINADPAFLTPYGGYVPDGISRHCLVERNLCVDNGASGGAAINLASVRESVIRDNVIVNRTPQTSTGIALWDDAAGPQWGCKDNLLEHNSVVFSSGAGRYAVTFMNGSTGNTLRNNLLRGGRRGAFAWTQDSLPGLVSGPNLLASVDGWPIVVRDEAVWQTFTLPQWQGLGYDAGSVAALPQFENEAGLVFGLLPSSPGRDAALRVGRPLDHGGSPRPQGAGPDLGALER